MISEPFSTRFTPHIRECRPSKDQRGPCPQGVLSPQGAVTEAGESTTEWGQGNAAAPLPRCALWASDGDKNITDVAPLTHARPMRGGLGCFPKAGEGRDSPGLQTPPPPEVRPMPRLLVRPSSDMGLAPTLSLPAGASSPCGRVHGWRTVVNGGEAQCFCFTLVSYLRSHWQVQYSLCRMLSSKGLIVWLLPLGRWCILSWFLGTVLGKGPTSFCCFPSTVCGKDWPFPVERSGYPCRKSCVPRLGKRKKEGKKKKVM